MTEVFVSLKQDDRCGSRVARVNDEGSTITLTPVEYDSYIDINGEYQSYELERHGMPALVITGEAECQAVRQLFDWATD